jgi:hypothetical protein
VAAEEHSLLNSRQVDLDVLGPDINQNDFDADSLCIERHA